MVNGHYLCDASRGKNLVEYTEDDVKYYDSLLSGWLQINEGQISFMDGATKKRYRVEKMGPMEADIEVESDPDLTQRAGVIGKVSRENDCNAYERGRSITLNGGAETINIFRVYKVSPEQ